MEVRQEFRKFKFTIRTTASLYMALHREVAIEVNFKDPRTDSKLMN